MESPTQVLHQGNSILSLETLPDYPHPVVVKQRSAGHVSDGDVRSLDNEYEMTRVLNGVAGVRQVLGQQSIDSEPALILEYVDGKTLQDLIVRNLLDLRSRLQIAVDLAGVLERIHERRVIHLDINSQNILIDNRKQAVHIIDLGAASRTVGNGLIKVQPDQVLVNVPYISPEQTGRVNRAVDERSDLYSLGAVLYELLTGRLPFDTRDPMQLIHHHIARKPASPSAVSPEIPEVLSAIILKLLGKDAEDRYQSAGKVSAALEPGGDH
jgi:serine/threonine protein kinase